MAKVAVAPQLPVKVVPSPALPLPVVRSNLLDRAIGAFSPASALRRYEARVRLAAASYLFGTGGYEGARTDRPATKNWQPKLGSADSDTIPDLPMLRARAADLERNDPIASGISETKSTHIVGTGIVPRAQIDRDLLGLSDDQADAWERDCDRIISWWMDSGACDLSGKADFCGLEEMALLGALGRGDILVVRRMRPRTGQQLLETRVQLVEADRVCNPDGKLNSDTLVDGVVMDEDGRNVSFYVLDHHPGEYALGYLPRSDFGKYSEVAAFGAAGDVRAFLLFKQRRPGQTRGTPLLASVIERLKQISRYGESELMAAVIQSFFTVFIKSQAGEDGLADMGDPNTLAQATSTPMTQNDVRLGQAAIVGLAPGEDIAMANPARPNSAFDPFMLAWFRQIGIAVNIPYEILIKHFSSSYSASRGAMLEFYRGVTRDRTWLVRRFCQPVREWALEEAIARGLLSAPGFFDNPLVRAAYCRAEWTGPTMGQLDPEAEINAAEKRVSLGVSTLHEVTAEITGGIWEQKHPQRVKETKMRIRDGLDVEPIAERIKTEPVEPEKSPDPAGKPAAQPSPTQRERTREREAGV